MARAWFGGGAADFVYRPSSGRYLRTVAATLTFWTDRVGGTQHTDLLLDGAPTSTITVAADGQVPEFQGPDGVIKLWVDAGGPRVQLDAAISSEDGAVATLMSVPDSETGLATDARVEDKVAADVANPASPIGAGFSATIEAEGNTHFLRVTEAPLIVRQSGVDDTAALQAALDMPGVTAGRAAAQLLPGAPYLSGPLLLKSHASIEGLTVNGFGTDLSVEDRTAVLKLLPSSAGPLIKDYNDTVGSVSIRRVTLDGNKANQSASNPVIEMTAAAAGADPRWILDEVYVRNGKGGGIKQGAHRRGMQMKDVQVYQCDGTGIELGASDNSLQQVSVGDCSGVGLKILAGTQRIFGGDLFANQVGMEIAAAAAGVMSYGVSMDRNDRQGALIKGPRNFFFGCIFAENSQETHNTWAHVDFDFPNTVAQYGGLIGTNFAHDVAFTKVSNYAIYTNVPVVVVGSMWNPSVAPYATGYTNSGHLLIQNQRGFAMLDGQGIRMGNSPTRPELLSGAGTPEGAVTANPGSIWMRRDGGAGTGFYVKETGTGNTGWVAK